MKNGGKDGGKDGGKTGVAGALGYRIMHLAALMARQARQSVKRDIGLPQAQWRVLLQLAVGGAQNPNAVAQETGLARSHVTQALQALGRRRLVSRKADREDGRRIVVALSGAGRALVEDGMLAHAPRRARLVAGMSARERATLDRALAKLTDAVQRLLDEEPAT